MSKDNVTPIRPRPIPDLVSTGEFASSLWEEALRLSRTEAKHLLNAETVMSGRVNEIGPELPTDLESYLDCNGNLCVRPKGEGERIRLENRQREYDERQRRLENVRHEVERMRLDEIDPDWRDHYITQDAAAAFYWKELGEYTDWGGGKPKRVLGRP